MPFRIIEATKPSSLDGYDNGKLPPELLQRLPGQDGGADLVLLKGSAARCWPAFEAEGRKHGHIFKVSSAQSTYRSYAQQLALWNDRMTTTRLPGRPSRFWNGRTWWLKYGEAAVAPPGSSWHSLALAVDCGEERDGDSAPEPFDDPTSQWIEDNAPRFGFTREIQSEPWHLRFFAGDFIPQAVREYEASNAPGPKPPKPAYWEDTMDICYVASTRKYYKTDGDKNVVEITKDEAEDLTSPIGGFRMHVFPTDALWRKVHNV
jgi:hypothetical protein